MHMQALIMQHSLPLLCNPVSCFAVVYGYHNRAHLLAIVKHAVFIVNAAVAAVRCSGRCLLHPPVSVHFFAQLVWQHSNQQHHLLQVSRAVVDTMALQSASNAMPGNDATQQLHKYYALTCLA